MIVPLIEIAVLAATVLCIVRWKAAARRRKEQTWDSLVGRLRSDWSARELTQHFHWREGLDATPKETWSRIRGAYGLWAMFQNAGGIRTSAYANALRFPPTVFTSVRFVPEART